MSRWWRAYDECVDDPKLLLLSDRTHRAWFNLMCLASANGGVLPEMKVMALKLRMSPAKVTGFLSELRASVLLDEQDGNLVPHNWNGRQFKSDAGDPTNADRQRRYRNRYSNGRSTVTPTVTEGVTAKRPETEAETERKKDAADAAPIDPEVDLFRRGKEVLGPGAGSLIARLKKTKGGSIPKARAAIEEASTKQDPREWIGRIIAGPANGGRTLMPNGQPFPDGIV